MKKEIKKEKIEEKIIDSTFLDLKGKLIKVKDVISKEDCWFLKKTNKFLDNFVDKMIAELNRKFRIKCPLISAVGYWTYDDKKYFGKMHLEDVPMDKIKVIGHKASDCPYFIFK